MNPNNVFIQHVIAPLIFVINNFPFQNAFCINDSYFSYKQLGQAISKIRFALKNTDENDRKFGLVANDDIETYASIFALWLEGKAFVPLHPSQPLERCIEIMNQININFVLDSSINTRFQTGQVIHTQNLLFSSEDLSYDYKIDNSNLAYILFTSGSTGIPKGVTISRNNIGSFMDSFWDTGIEISKEDRCLQCFDLGFDVSIQCLLAPLTKGACVYTVPQNMIKYSYVFGLLKNKHLTFCVIPPSLLRYLKQYFSEIHAPDVKYCIVTGEASPSDLISNWQTCVPNATIYNFYGPTETTIYCTYYKIVRNEEIKSLNGMLSIGKPMKNVDVIVVDEDCNILKKGQKGELCVSGDQVSPGYWNNTEKNAKAFFDKNRSGKCLRYYHTGDICHIDDVDDILLHGRIDSQVKIQGYRIELGEIEFLARKVLSGNNVVVIPFTNCIGNLELALFVEGVNIDTDLIIDFMKTRIPLFMIPTKIFIEREFPLNQNGKIDKNKLELKTPVFINDKFASMSA